MKTLSAPPWAPKSPGSTRRAPEPGPASDRFASSLTSELERAPHRAPSAPRPHAERPTALEPRDGARRPAAISVGRERERAEDEADRSARAEAHGDAPTRPADAAVRTVDDARESGPPTGVSTGGGSELDPRDEPGQPPRTAHLADTLPFAASALEGSKVLLAAGSAEMPAGAGRTAKPHASGRDPGTDRPARDAGARSSPAHGTPALDGAPKEAAAGTGGLTIGLAAPTATGSSAAALAAGTPPSTASGPAPAATTAPAPAPAAATTDVVPTAPEAASSDATRAAPAAPLAEAPAAAGTAPGAAPAGAGPGVSAMAAVVAEHLRGVEGRGAPAEAARIMTTPGSPAEAAPTPPLPESAVLRFVAEARSGGRAMLEIQHPKYGALQVELTMEQGRMVVRVASESAAAAATLRASESQLRGAVAKHGVELRGLHVECTGQGRRGRGRTRRNPDGSLDLDMEA